MYGWEQVFAEYPYLRTAWDALIILVPLATMIAYAGIYFISATAKILSIARKRAAFDKCSRQLALLGLIMGWTLLVCGRVWLYQTSSEHPQGTLESFLLEMSWLLLSLGVLLSSIYYCLWRILRNMPVLHSTLGMISAVQNCLAYAVIFFTIRTCAISGNLHESAFSLPDLFPDTWNDPLWSAVCYTLPLLFAMPGAISACWLVFRRKKDDFGRDYYNAMIPWVCAWARNAWSVLWLLLLVSSLLQIWQETQQGDLGWQQIILDGDRVLVWLVPLLLWIAVIRSRIPMRLSWMLFAAFILAGFFMVPYYFEIIHI